MEEMNDYSRLSIMENNINNNRSECERAGKSVATRWKQKMFKRYLFRNNDLLLHVLKGTSICDNSLPSRRIM